MAIEYRDGSFSQTMTFTEAVDKFFGQVDSGLVRALHVGTFSEIEERKATLKISDRLAVLEEKIKEKEPILSTILYIPTKAELKEFEIK